MLSIRGRGLFSCTCQAREPLSKDEDECTGKALQYLFLFFFFYSFYYYYIIFYFIYKSNKTEKLVQVHYNTNATYIASGCHFKRYKYKYGLCKNDTKGEQYYTTNYH